MTRGLPYLNAFTRFFLVLVAAGVSAHAQNQPVILSGPQNFTATQGTNVVFAVSASGQAPLTYRWFRDGTLLVNDGTHVFGAGSAQLGIQNVSSSDAGSYWATVSNRHGLDTSSTGVLSVITPPFFALEPTDLNVPHSTTATLVAQVAGTGPLSYQWRRNGTNVLDSNRHIGSKNSKLVINNVQIGDAGLYTLVASNIAGVTESHPALLRVVPIRVWGNDFFGQTTPPPQLADAVAIDYGSYRVLGLDTNGTLKGWGLGEPGVDATNLLAFAAGNNFGIGITKQRTVVGWGNNDNGQIAIPAGLSNVVEVAAGGYHGLALREDGTVVAWGHNSHGQASVPAGLSNVVAISGGGYHSLALKSDGSIVGFGNNYPYNQATPPSGLDRVVSISCGSAHNLALQAGGYVWAWGDNYYGQVGNAYALSQIVEVEAGHFHSIAVARNGYIHLWGDNSGGQTTLPFGISNVVAISGGNFGTAALLDNPVTGIVPAFIGTPFSRTVFKDGTTLLKPKITGSKPMSCQWFFNNTAMPGHTSPWLLLTGMQTNQSGLYYVVLSNRFGVSTSAVTTVTVELQKPYFTQQPEDVARTTGQNVTFWATAAGSTPLSYQWYFNGDPVPGQNGTWLYLENLQTTNSGEYWNVASNAAGATKSAVAKLTVVVPVTISKQPESQSWLMGTNASLTVEAAGTEPITYQWWKDHQPLSEGPRVSGVTSNRLTILDVRPEDAGEYYIYTYNNWANWQRSSSALITVLTPPTILTAPKSVAAPASTNVTLTVAAGGTPPLAYQWHFEETALNERTNSILTLTNVQSWHAGAYRVVVTNFYGSVTSSVALLAVTPSTVTITSLSTSRVASVGQPVNLSVSARGSEPFYYQWQRNGTNVPDAIDRILTINPINASLAGAYSVVVTNAVNTVISSNIHVWVSPVQTWGMSSGGQSQGLSGIPASATNIVAIAAAPIVDGALPCIALRADGSIVTWGYFSRDVPPPSNTSNVVAISLGAAAGAGQNPNPNNLLLKSDGTLLHLQNGVKPPIPPEPADGNFVAVAAGGQHQLALRDDGTVVAWGSNTYGQTNVPTGVTNIIAIAAGAAHSLALRVDGAVIGWGYNAIGQTNSLANATPVDFISAGGNQSAGISEGKALGVTWTTSQMFGAPPAFATNLLALSAGYSHALGLKADRTVMAWGVTNYGKATVPSYTSNVLAIAAGGNVSLALVDDPFDTPIPPQIARPPLTRTITAGIPAVFNTLSIGDAPMSYLWLKGGEAAPSQTNAFLHLPYPLVADGGNYQLVSMNSHGAITSQVCTVTVLPPKPNLHVSFPESDIIELQFQTLPGFEYVTEFSASLESPSWQLFHMVSGDGSVKTIVDPDASQKSRFYRVTVR